MNTLSQDRNETQRKLWLCDNIKYTTQLGWQIKTKSKCGFRNKNSAKTFSHLSKGDSNPSLILLTKTTLLTPKTRIVLKDLQSAHES